VRSKSVVVDTIGGAEVEELGLLVEGSGGITSLSSTKKLTM